MPWCSWLARDVPSRLDIQLVSVEDAFEAHRRFPRWLPGTVMGVGALAVVGGFLFVRSGQEKMNDYDQTIARECAVNGCDFTQLEQWRDLRDAVSMVVGGVAVAGGFVMLLMNRPTRRLKVDLAASTSGATAVTRWTF